MMLESSRVVVSPRSSVLPVTIFLRSLRMTFPDRVLGRRFTIWKERAQHYSLGWRPDAQPASKHTEIRRALPKGQWGPWSLVSSSCNQPRGHD